MKKETDVTPMANQLAAGQEVQPTGDNEQFYGVDGSGQFGPSAPVNPYPIGGDPRQWQYRAGWNLPTSPQNDRPTGVDLLRYLADNYDLLRKCIEIRKFEICSLEWDIVPREKSQKKAKELHQKYSALIDEIKAFFMYPEAYMVITVQKIIPKHRFT